MRRLGRAAVSGNSHQLRGSRMPHKCQLRMVKKVLAVPPTAPRRLGKSEQMWLKTNLYRQADVMQKTTKKGDRNLIKGATGDWQVVIGLEVHAQVASNAKLFSGASTAFGGAPNSHVSLVDAAMPGMLPVINEECVRQAVRTGLGLNAKVNLKSVFDRKNYFYPDLPQGYQISQYKSPIVGEGEVVVD